jgi:hypothetical protein
MCNGFLKSSCYLCASTELIIPSRLSIGQLTAHIRCRYFGKLSTTVVCLTLPTYLVNLECTFTKKDIMLQH